MNTYCVTIALTGCTTLQTKYKVEAATRAAARRLARLAAGLYFVRVLRCQIIRPKL